MRTVVAAPTDRVKDYSLAQWAAATAGHDRFLVTTERDYMPDIQKHGIPVFHYEPPLVPDKPFPIPDPLGTRHIMCGSRFNAAWSRIVGLAEAGGYTHTLSLEIDVIPPEDIDIVGLMESEWDGSVDFLIHLYPYRPSYKRPGKKCNEMGCTMAKTETWRKALDTMPPTGMLYWAVRQTKDKNPRFHFTNKQIDIVELQHLE